VSTEYVRARNLPAGDTDQAARGLIPFRAERDPRLTEVPGDLLDGFAIAKRAPTGAMSLPVSDSMRERSL
jgi:hypothetical protein